MKNRKVLNFRTHVGGKMGKTSYDAVKDKAEIELWPVGVYINSMGGAFVGILVPYPNCTEVQLAEEKEQDAPVEITRKPGRPPKDPSAA